MKTLLSLPPNLVESFHQLEKVNIDQYFCTSDPIGSKLGSGGGTTWLLAACKKQENDTRSLSEWLSKEKRILLHAGGQSRRLPAYAPSGKILTPIPVFDWERGQRLKQNLLSLQLPLYEEILEKAPTKIHTLIASGDVYIRTEKSLQEIPEADIICYGLWTNPSLATNHGVFVMKRSNSEELDYMLQKPNLETLETLSKTHLYLMDIGIWLLSDRAMEVLISHSYLNDSKEISYYDMYSEYGLSLGKHPQITDKELNKLSVAILPLQGGEFYHYGTSKELLSSTLTIQNKEFDQRKIMHHKVKPNPAIFVQNAVTDFSFSNKNENIWIENSYIGKNWKLGSSQIITCVPPNNWNLSLPDNICIDVVPINEKYFAARPYGFFDIFKGSVSSEKTIYLNKSITTWLKERDLKIEELKGDISDIQSTRLFPITESIEELGLLFKWMISEPQLEKGKELWIKSKKLSADELSNHANLTRLYAQRESYRKENWTGLARNYEKSVFYQLDLVDAAQEYNGLKLPIPEILDESASLMTKIHNRMLRSYIYQLRGDKTAIKEQETAFSLLRDGLMGELSGKDSTPHLNVYSDQIVWGRCPVRIDVAGGWTDTPPYSLYVGGNVVNFAIELNGQPPLQVYIKPTSSKHILLRSIDMGATEIVSTYEELMDYKKVGSPFSIPKAALVLTGFSPLVSFKKYKTLEEQLKEFGAGLEVTLLAAIPTGSGLGTSSILASTVLGALNDFCGLEWDKNEICKRTLALEQLLTTGGGWQDQYGGVLQGVKFLQSDSGFNQSPLARWLPTDLFTSPEYRDCHLLYYTGITRTAKNILAEIVRSMFLNSNFHLRLLSEMKRHAISMNEAILKNDFAEYGKLVYQTWQQNKLLDRGTNPPAIEALINQIKDYCLGYKLPGAGGGGYLYMVAKDPQAAQYIKKILSEHAPNKRARFVNMTLSNKGFQVSRS
ncbi:MAG: bifunctional fucokinase/L-fucose-1-P-guanylyltransferase [Bacteroidales bacterium]|nr:bifunctional fucokinase/L-fucose-1-P-guanylyltransferase [Bacteroidales bacterium]